MIKQKGFWKGKLIGALFILAIMFFILPLDSFVSNAAEEITPLTFTALQDNSSVTFDYQSGSNVQFKINDGEWTEYSKGATIMINEKDTVSFKGKQVSTSQTNHFSMEGSIAASGDVTSLVNEVGGDTDLGSSYCCFMFSGCTELTSAPNLPSTSLIPECYTGMFYGCTGLTSAPELPATTLSPICYDSMFYGCTGLTSAPELPATSLTHYCYGKMFYGCTGLTNAPELLATSLDSYCYYAMFYGCTGLTSAPILPATSLETSCYSTMFKGCSSLTSAPDLPATSLEEDCYYAMFEGCTGLTNAPILPATSLATFCYYAMFKDCTGLTSAPTLPATSMAVCCYSRMFEGCTGLTNAPALPATSLDSYCYNSMFSGCTGLKSAPALKVTSLDEWCCTEMFSNCTGLKVEETDDESLATWIFPDQDPIQWGYCMIFGLTAPGTLTKVQSGKMYIVTSANATPSTPEFGWYQENGKSYWYEEGIRQGTLTDPKGILGMGTVRGREICDMGTKAWYWLDACFDGAKACNKEVWMPYIYQDEAGWDDAAIWRAANLSGTMAQQVYDSITNRTGKWVRYDKDGKMYKGWYTVPTDSDIYLDQRGNTYYYDEQTGLMAKGWTVINGKDCFFDKITGVYDANRTR